MVNEFVHFKATGNEEGLVNIKIGEMGEVSCPEAEEGSINSYRSYMRDSGKEKRVVVSYTREGTAFINQRDNIIHNYDVLAGIDTNDYITNERRISIASSFYAGSIQSSTVEFKIMPSFIISDVRVEINPEVVGWHLFIRHILPLLKLNKGRKLGLVVDTELGKHIVINRREEAYYNEYYLPENIGLIYASSDTGQDLTNQLIQSCDLTSRQLFKKIQEGDLVLPSQLGGGTEDFSGYAYVNYEESEYKIEN